MIFDPLNCGTIGVFYGDANRFLSALELCGTDIHALSVMRRGITGFEGYWAPWGPEVIHGDQSLTKTLTGIALGTAIQEGILRLDEKLTDVFPEYRALTAGRPYWDELCVRHIATMSAGMETQPKVWSGDLTDGFFRQEIVHRPGTAFMYNSSACSMVGMCVRKRSGQWLLEYLSDRVFRKIGIDPEKVAWHRHPNGLENGSGGFMSTVHDNALLMELYRLGGVWNGERILDEDWVRFALQIQNPFPEGEVKYGGMMWVREKCFVADGAMGQWSMLFPEKELVISIQQTAASRETENAVREAIYDFAASLKDTPAVWTEEEAKCFRNRLSRLSIPQPEVRNDLGLLRSLSGKTLKVTEGTAHFYADDLIIFDERYLEPVRSFGFTENNGDLLLTVTSDAGTVTCPVSFRGYRSVVCLPSVNGNPARTASVTGISPEKNVIRLEVRWLESCRIHLVTFRFDEKGASVTTSRIPVGGFDVPDEVAAAVWEKE